MTTSGTVAFNPAVIFLITEMYRDLDVITDTEAPEAGQVSSAMFKLNSLVKSLEATGIHVWTEEEGILFLQPGVERYTIGAPSPDASAHTADAADWIQLQLAQSYSAAQSVLSITGGEALVDGSNIGVVMDSGVTFWTTVAATALNSVTLTAPLPGSASAQNVVLDYPAGGEITRPLKVPNARLLTFSGNTEGQPGQETPMTVLSRQEYMDLPNKRSLGVPTQWFYSPKLDRGVFYIWPVPQQTRWAVRFTWYRSICDLLTPSNTLDFPQEWVTPLRWLLANEMMVGFSVSAERSTLIQKNAATWMETILGWDRESEPVQFGMDYRY